MTEYAASKKLLVDKNKKQVVDAIQRSLKRATNVQFVAYTRWEHKDKFSVVMEITKRKKVESRTKYWSEEGFVVSNVSDTRDVKEGELFQIAVKGNVEQVEYGAEEGEFELTYQKNRQNNRTFLLQIKDSKETECTMKIKRVMIEYETVMVVRSKDSFLCFKSTETLTEKKQKKEFTKLAKLKITLKEPKKEETDTTPAKEVLLTAQQNTDSSDEENDRRKTALGLSKSTEVAFSVLNAHSIRNLLNQLSLEEASLFGIQMGLPTSIRQDLENAPSHSRELTLMLSNLWRGSKHSRNRVNKICMGLDSINRADLARAFRKACLDDNPFSTEYLR